jgi:hypothetical protein
MGISALMPATPAPVFAGVTPGDVNVTSDPGSSSFSARADHLHKLADSGWLAPVLQNGWVVYDATYGSAAMYRKVGNIVLVRGLVRNGTVAATIFTLPAGFRPGIRMLFAAETNPNVNCRIDVDPTGTINGSGESNGWLSLGNIIFVADA